MYWQILVNIGSDMLVYIFNYSDSVFLSSKSHHKIVENFSSYINMKNYHIIFSHFVDYGYNFPIEILIYVYW